MIFKDFVKTSKALLLSILNVSKDEKKNPSKFSIYWVHCNL